MWELKSIFASLRVVSLFVSPLSHPHPLGALCQDVLDQLHAAADTVLEVVHPLSQQLDGPEDFGDGATSTSKSRASGARSTASRSTRKGSVSGGKSTATSSARTKSASTVAPPSTVGSKTLKTIASGVGGTCLATLCFASCRCRAWFP